ncbi:Fur family transcriptional regulator [Streptomyces thermocoprophilus]|uniref:Fur family transcriptional regulator n=1 Tax=Streptomyces thermocoprophilus TaxID=78356 RepID=A0ABV5VKJ7_9ACTN
MCNCTLTATATDCRSGKGPRTEVASQTQGAFSLLQETHVQPHSAELPAFRSLLRLHGLRCTPGRLRILALFRDSECHLSTAEASAQLGRTGDAVHPTTVYRTLETLTAAGLVHAVPGPGPTRYGRTGEPHHHTVCQDCGHVGTVATTLLREAMARIEQLTGLRPDSSEALLVYGRCARCTK